MRTVFKYAGMFTCLSATYGNTNIKSSLKMNYFTQTAFGADTVISMFEIS